MKLVCHRQIRQKGIGLPSTDNDEDKLQLYADYAQQTKDIQCTSPATIKFTCKLCASLRQSTVLEAAASACTNKKQSDKGML